MSKEIVEALLSQNSQYADGFGRIIPDDVKDNPGKIADLIGASYQVERRPVFFKNPDGSFTKAPGREVLVRPDTIFNALQTELAAHQLHISYGTTAKNGSVITVCAQLPSEYDIVVNKTDVLKSFLMLTTDYKSKGKIRALKGTFRVVSDATLTTTLDESTISDLMKNMGDIVKQESHTFNLMAQTEMTNSDLIKFFADSLDVDASDIGKIVDGKKVISTKTENILKGITESYVSAPGADIAKGTVWGAYCAVLFYATKLKTVRDTTGTGAEMARAVSNLNGDAGKLKVKAYELAVAFCAKATKPKPAAKAITNPKSTKKKVAKAVTVKPTLPEQTDNTERKAA